jgi:hypothetical protein
MSALVAMTHPRDYLPVLDRFEVALEATCDALMTLQSIDVHSAVAEDERVGRHVTQAISDLRHAIDELRKAQTHGHTGLGLGFVLARDRRNGSPGDEPGQSSPRRTA